MFWGVQEQCVVLKQLLLQQVIGFITLVIYVILSDEAQICFVRDALIMFQFCLDDVCVSLIVNSIFIFMSLHIFLNKLPSSTVVEQQGTI